MMEMMMTKKKEGVGEISSLPFSLRASHDADDDNHLLSCEMSWGFKIMALFLVRAKKRKRESRGGISYSQWSRRWNYCGVKWHQVMSHEKKEQKQCKSSGWVAKKRVKSPVSPHLNIFSFVIRKWWWCVITFKSGIYKEGSTGHSGVQKVRVRRLYSVLLMMMMLLMFKILYIIISVVMFLIEEGKWSDCWSFIFRDFHVFRLRPTWDLKRSSHRNDRNIL